MLSVVKILSTSITSGKRIIKFLRMGKSDVQTSNEAMPFGFDSNPTKDLIAIYGQSATKGDTVIIGYINKNQLADIGELRLYSTDDNGNQKFYVWLHNDGTCEIGGDTNYAVKFNELKTEFNKLKDNFNNFLLAYNTHTHVGVTVGSGATGMTTPSTETNTSNIDNAKNDKIKTIG